MHLLPDRVNILFSLFLKTVHGCLQEKHFRGRQQDIALKNNGLLFLLLFLSSFESFTRAKNDLGERKSRLGGHPL